MPRVKNLHPSLLRPVSQCPPRRRSGSLHPLFRHRMDQLERPTGCLVGSSGAQIPCLRGYLLASGLHAVVVAADHLRLRPVLHHCVRRRVWCGYTCPQSVFTWVFMWAEKVTEGDRNQRMKLDKAPMSGSKFIRKLGKHSIWLFVSFATGSPLSGTSPPSANWYLTCSPCRLAAGPCSGWLSSRSPPTATPAICASRSASTCARMHASRA